MGFWAFAIFLFWGTFLPSSGEHPIENIVPEIPEKLGLMLKILLPRQGDMLKKVKDLVGSYSIPLNSETERCRNHSAVLLDSFLNNDMWALRMVDASSKPTAGILDGNVQDLGNYDECVAVSDPHGLFHGQRCVVETRGVLPPKELDKLSHPATDIDSLAWIPWQTNHMVVEVFFVLSGTLGAYNFFRDRLKGKRFSYLSFCVHRYLRLTPVMFLLTIFYATLLIRETDGPVWQRMFSTHYEICQKNWWINLLYISNYATPSAILLSEMMWFSSKYYSSAKVAKRMLSCLHRCRGVDGKSTHISSSYKETAHNFTPPFF